MKTEKYANRVTAVLILCLFIIPVITMNHQRGRISETENRLLADFPDIFDEDGNLAENFMAEFESWLGDNLGFRSELVGLSTNIRLKIFHQSNTDRVEIGRNGWYFYTGDHNIDLASGAFTLSEETLQIIAENQQNIANWYASQGISYILVLTPAKTSIYPENIALSNCSVRVTPCDQVEQYLTEHTTVQVVNPKNLLIERKSEGKVYPQHDSHWTQLGSYTAYQMIEEKLRSLGIPVKSFSVDFDELETSEGDLLYMMGVAGALMSEVRPYAQWDTSVEEIKDGTLYEILSKLDVENKIFPMFLFGNTDAENRTLLIYGDSAWQKDFNIPQWLGESFQTIITTNHRSINQELDEAAKPDVVIFGCGERLIDYVLTLPLNIPIVQTVLPELPLKDVAFGESMGMNIDVYNGISLTDGIIFVDPAADIFELSGWAVDFCNDLPLQEMYLQVGDFFFRCDYNGERPDVASYFNKDSLVKTGFQIKLPARYLQNGTITEVAFIGVSADGGYLYTPVTYHLSYS